MTTAVQNQNWAPIGNPEGKNLNPWQKLRPAKLAQIPPRDAPAASPSQGNLAEQTTITKAGTLSVTTYAPRWYSPYAATITNIRASVNTAPTGAAIIVDVLKNGSTIFTTTANRPTIAISGFTATGTPDAVQIAAGDYFQIQIVQVGSTVAGADLTVEITYQTLGVTQATITGLQGPTGATGPGNLATDTLWDTKGDLAVGTGADTAAKLVVGSNTQVLTADSTQSTGLKWATPASGTAHGCGLHHSTTQSVNNTTDTRALFDSENDDTDAYHSTSSNTSRITVPTGLAGVYLITASITWAGNGTGARFLQFYKNGANISHGSSQAMEPGIAGGGPSLTSSTFVRLAVGDYVEVNCYQNSGGALNIGTTNDYDRNVFSAYLIGA